MASENTIFTNKRDDAAEVAEIEAHALPTDIPGLLDGGWNDSKFPKAPQLAKRPPGSGGFYWVICMPIAP